MAGRDAARKRNWTDSIEESFIALLMFAMVAITFAAVVARESDATILWAYEATKILFAWLVLIGASYTVKVNANLGVDVLLMMMSSRTKRILTWLAVAVCIGWALIFVWASFEYWWPFVTKRAWYEVDDIPMPAILAWMADVFNEGEAYEKMPRFIPYAVLPIASLLLLLRFVQAAIMVAKGEREQIIVSHEAEEMIEEVKEREAEGVSAESVDPRSNGGDR
ncbi:MAG: TRAP transporter small permease [Pseudomonadota bacterium]